jgi:hypothetical protein
MTTVLISVALCRPSTWPARVSGKQVVVYLASLLILEIVPFLDVAFF